MPASSVNGGKPRRGVVDHVVGFDAKRILDELGGAVSAALVVSGAQVFAHLGAAPIRVFVAKSRLFPRCFPDLGLGKQ